MMQSPSSPLSPSMGRHTWTGNEVSSHSRAFTDSIANTRQLVAPRTGRKDKQARGFHNRLSVYLRRVLCNRVQIRTVEELVRHPWGCALAQARTTKNGATASVSVPVSDWLLCVMRKFEKV